MSILGSQDDKNARLNKIFQDNLHDMYIFALSRMHNPDEANEVIQLASVKFLEIFDEKSHIPDDKLKTYLFDIIASRCKNYWRDSKRRLDFITRNIINFEPEAPPLEDQIFGEIDADIIRQCIRELPDEYEKFFRLSDDPNITPQMLADILNVKPSSLRMIRSRARKLLKEACEAKGVEVTVGAKRRKK